MKFNSYKPFYAQNHAPALDEIGIRPLACTGVLRCADGLVFARRSDSVMLNQNTWELAPSGIFDEFAVNPDGTLSTQTTFTNEMAEELGILEKTPQIQEVLVALEDLQQNSIDLTVPAKVQFSAKEIHSHFRSRQTKEYSKVAVVRENDVCDFVTMYSPDIVPISLEILDILNLT